jgi:hypothetical protein
VEDKSRMAAKIAALLAQAEGEAKAGNEEAVQAFLDKAQALQLKFAIADSMLPKGDRTKEEIVFADFCQEANTPLIKAKRELVNGLATLYRGKAFLAGEYRKDANGKMLYTTHRGKWGPVYDKRAKVRVYAHESDLRFIEQMYTSLILQMQTFMAEAEKHQEIFTGVGRVANAWRVSFAYGYVRRLYSRLHEAKRRQEREANNDQPGTALVLVDRQALVQAEVDRMVGPMKTVRHREDNDGSGTRAGRDAADRADLGDCKLGRTGSRGELSS